MTDGRFGKTSNVPGAPPSPTLQRATVTFLPDNICMENLPQKLLSQLCTSAPGALEVEMIQQQLNEICR